MSSETIPSRTFLKTDDQEWYNLFKRVLSGDLLPRDQNAAVGPGVADLGDAVNYWRKLFVKEIQFTDGTTFVKGSLIATGTIIKFAGNNAPPGFLFCDGREISRTTYAQLFSVIGENYGEGNGTTTFNIPDLRAQFIRGTDNMGSGSAGVDPDTSSRTAAKPGGNTGNNVGSSQESEVGPHNHSFTGNGATNLNPHPIIGPGSTLIGGVINTQSSGITESRPVNVYLKYMIQI